VVECPIEEVTKSPCPRKWFEHAERHYDCRVGLNATLHTWGQRMNRHVYCHVIMTAGGLSLDGTR
jgi:hypothetical protein